MPSSDDQAGLEVHGLRKIFGGNVALADVSLAFRFGEIHGLLGENGAGKSTLIKVLAGAYPADGGTISLDGRRIDPITSDAVTKAGVAFIHQDFGLVESLSVAENIALTVGYARSRTGLISWHQSRREAERVLASMGLSIPVEQKVGDLSIGLRATVAIARAIAMNARVLVLDEPTATLAAAEVESLFRILRALRSRSVAVVLVSHRMDEVFSICDRVTVLRDGHVAGVRSLPAAAKDDIVDLILGRSRDSEPLAIFDSGNSSDPVRDVALEVRGLEGVAVGPLDFELHSGEILGLTGLAGAGHDEIGRVIFGIDPAVGGEMRLRGHEHRPRGPRDSVLAGMSYVPADRANDGLSVNDTIEENLGAAATIDRTAGMHVILRRADDAAAANRAIMDFSIRPGDPYAPVSSLSGGNAQKVLLAKSFQQDPLVVILNEPTVGVDVGAREQIYRLIRESAASRHTAAIVISSDLEEIATLCDRAIVFYHGQISAVIEDATVDRITDAALRRGSKPVETTREAHG